MTAGGIATGRIPGDDEPPMEGLVDGNVSSFGRTTPESDIDSTVLHWAQRMPDGREGTRLRKREVKGSGNACCSNLCEERRMRRSDGGWNVI